jgi:hypothetical protein
MGRTAKPWNWLALGLLLVYPSCTRSDATYVRLDFKGTLDRPIHFIAVDVSLGLRTDRASFEEPEGGTITLPVSAALEITSGEGELGISASALDEQGGILATGTGAGQVRSGQTTSVEVWLFAQGQDAGADGSAEPDGAAAPGKDGASSSEDFASFGPEASTGDAMMVRDDTSVIGGEDGGAGGAGVGGTSGTTSGEGGATTNPGTGGSTPGSGGAAGSSVAGSGNGGNTTGGNTTGGASGMIAGAGGAGGTSDTRPPPPCQLNVSPQNLDFGPVPVGTMSPAKAVTATNLGSGVCSKLSVYVNDGQHFPVAQTPCSGQTLGPNVSCTAFFNFNPDLVGPFTTDASISAAEGPKARFNLTGAGQDPNPQLTMNPTSVDFKLRDVGSVASMEFTVTSSGGSEPGAISVLLNGWPAFSVVNNQCASVSLPKGGRCTFTLLFIPPSFGPGKVQIDAKSSSGGKATSFAYGTGRDYATLNVAFAGTGKGAVTGTNLNCHSGSPCGISIELTDPVALPKVELTAQADDGSQFVGWKGPCSGTDKCGFVMDGPKNVTAVFEAR